MKIEIKKAVIEFRSNNKYSDNSIRKYRTSRAAISSDSIILRQNSHSPQVHCLILFLLLGLPHRVVEFDYSVDRPARHTKYVGDLFYRFPLR